MDCHSFSAGIRGLRIGSNRVAEYLIAGALGFLPDDLSISFPRAQPSRLAQLSQEEDLPRLSLEDPLDTLDSHATGERST